MVKTTQAVHWGSPLVSLSLVPSWSSDDSLSSSLSLSSSTSSSSSYFDDRRSCKDDDAEISSSGRPKSRLVRRSSLTKSTRIAVPSPSGSAVAALQPKQISSSPPKVSSVIDKKVRSPGARYVSTAPPSSSSPRPPRQQQQKLQRQHQHLQHLLSPNRPKQQQPRKQSYQPDDMLEEDDDSFSPPPPPHLKAVTPMRRRNPTKRQSPINSIQRVTAKLTKAVRSSSLPSTQKQKPTSRSPQTRPLVTKENLHTDGRATSKPRFATPRMAGRINYNKKTRRDSDGRDNGGEGFEVIESETTSPRINYTRNTSNNHSPLRSITAQPIFVSRSTASSEANPMNTSTPTSKRSLRPINRCHNPIDSGSSFSESVASSSSTEGMTQTTYEEAESDYHTGDRKDLKRKTNDNSQQDRQQNPTFSVRRNEKDSFSGEDIGRPDIYKSKQAPYTNIARHDSNGSSSSSNCSNVGVYHYMSESDTNKSSYGGGAEAKKNNDWSGNIYNSTTKDSLYVSFVMMNPDDEGNIETVQYTTAASASGRCNQVPAANTTTTTLSSSSLDTILARPFSDQHLLTESSLSIGEGSSSLGMDEPSPPPLLELISTGSSSLEQSSNRNDISGSGSEESSCPSDENRFVERRSKQQQTIDPHSQVTTRQGPIENTTIPEELSIVPPASTSELPVPAFKCHPENDCSNKIPLRQQQRTGNVSKLNIPPGHKTSQFQQPDKGPQAMQQQIDRPVGNNSHLLSSSIVVDPNGSVVNGSRSSASDSSVTRSTLDDYSSHRIRMSLLSLDEEDTDDDNCTFQDGEDSSYNHENDGRVLFYVESEDHDDYIYAKQPIKQKQAEGQPQTLNKICSFQSTKRCYKPRRRRNDDDQNQHAKNKQESQAESQEFEHDIDEQNLESQHEKEQHQEKSCPRDQNQQSKNQQKSHTESHDHDKDDDNEQLQAAQETHREQHQEKCSPNEDVSDDLEQKQDEPEQKQAENPNDGHEKPPSRKDQPPDPDERPQTDEDQPPNREEQQQRDLKELLLLGQKLTTKPKFINSFHGSTFSPVYQVHKMDWEQLTKRRLQQRRMRMMRKQQQQQEQQEQRKRDSEPTGNPNSILSRRNMGSILLSSSSSSSSFLSVSTRNDKNHHHHLYNHYRSSSNEEDESRHDRYSSFYDDIEDEDDDELCNIITTKFSATKNIKMLYKEQNETEGSANSKSRSCTREATSQDAVSCHNINNDNDVYDSRKDVKGNHLKDVMETNVITAKIFHNRDNASCTEQPSQHHKLAAANEHDDCNDSIFSSIIETAPSDELHIYQTFSDSTTKLNLNNKFIDTIVCQQQSHDDDQLHKDYIQGLRKKERMMSDEFSSYPEFRSKMSIISSTSNTESPKAISFANYCHDGVISGATSNYSSIIEETDYDDDDDLCELLEDDLLENDDESSGIVDHSYSRDDVSTISSSMKASSSPTPFCLEKEEWKKTSNLPLKQRTRKNVVYQNASVMVEEINNQAIKQCFIDDNGNIGDNQSPITLLCQEVVTSIESDDTDIAITSSIDWHDTDFSCVPNLLNRQMYESEDRQDTNTLYSRGNDPTPLHESGQFVHDPTMGVVDDTRKTYGTKNAPRIETRNYCIVSDCSADSMSEVRDSFMSLLTTPKTRISGKRGIFGVAADTSSESMPEEKDKQLSSLTDDSVPFDEEFDVHLANYQYRKKGTEQTIVPAGRSIYFKQLVEPATATPLTTSNHQRRNKLMKFLFDDPDDTSLLMSLPNRILIDLFERSLSRLWYVTMNCVALRAVLINTDISTEKKLKTIDSVSSPAVTNDTEVNAAQRQKENSPEVRQESILLQKDKYPISVEEQRLINHHHPDFESFFNCNGDDSSFAFPSVLYQCCDEVNALTGNCAGEPFDDLSSIVHNDVQFRFVRTSKGSEFLKQKLMIGVQNKTSDTAEDWSDEENRDNEQQQLGGKGIDSNPDGGQIAPTTDNLLDCDSSTPVRNCVTTENKRPFPVPSKTNRRSEQDHQTSRSFRLDPKYLIIRLTKWRNASGSTTVMFDERDQDVENEAITNDNTKSATKFQAVLESPISSNKVNIRIDKKNRVVCSTSILPFVTCTTPLSEQVASYEAEDDDISIEFVDEQQRLVQDDELRALMQITQNGDDISTLFPSFSSFEEASLMNPYSTDEDDGLERELDALSTHGIELRNEIGAYDRIYMQSGSTTESPPILEIQNPVELDGGLSADTLDSNSTGPHEALNPDDPMDLPSAEVVRKIMEAVNEELPLLSMLSTVHESSNEDSDADDNTEIIEHNMSHEGLATPRHHELTSSTPINCDQNYQPDESKNLLSPRWHKPEGSNADLPSQFDDCTSSEKEESDDQLSAVDSFPPVDVEVKQIVSDIDVMVNETSSFVMSIGKNGNFHVHNTVTALTSNSFASIGSGTDVCRVSPQSNLCQRKVTFSEHVEEFLYLKDNLSNYNFNPVDDTTIENPPGIFPSIDEMKGILTELVDEIHKVVNTATIAIDRTCSTSVDYQVESPREEMNSFL